MFKKFIVSDAVIVFVGWLCCLLWMDSMLCHLFSFVDFSIVGAAVVDGDFLVIAGFLVLLLKGLRLKELSAMSATANEGFK